MLNGIERFRNHLQVQRGAAPLTLKSYSEDLLQLHQYLERQPEAPARWSEVDRRRLRGFQLHLADSGYARRSISRKLAAIRTFFRFLVRNWEVEQNPAVGLFSPRQQRRLPHALRPAEIEALLQVPDRLSPLGLRDAAVLEVLYSSGMRASELVSLTRERALNCRGPLRVVGKGRNERTVFLGRAAMEALAA